MYCKIAPVVLNFCQKQKLISDLDLDNHPKNIILSLYIRFSKFESKIHSDNYSKSDLAYSGEIKKKKNQKFPENGC